MFCQVCILVLEVNTTRKKHLKKKIELDILYREEDASDEVFKIKGYEGRLSNLFRKNHVGEYW